jgi:predicted enzyme related to lactoylglutathione lyase
MNIKEIAFVCYAVEDVPKARRFYEKVLGLTASSVWEGEDMAFVEYEIGPHCLAIGKGAPTFKVGKAGGTAALEVGDFDAAAKELKAAGVKFLMEPHETGSCHMMLVEDPDGNQVMIHKRKAK